MKHKLLLLLLLLLNALGAWAQLPRTESFETDGNGVVGRYTSNTFNSGNNNYSFRSTYVQGSVPSGFNPTSSRLFGLDGNYFWASEGVNNSTTATPLNGAPAFVQLSPTTITGYANLKVTVLLADPQGAGSNGGLGRWESDDFIRIKARIDGGTWVTIGQFVGDNSNTGGTDGFLRRDVLVDGVSTNDPASGTNVGQLTATLRPFTFDVIGGGTTMDVMVEIAQVGNSEEFAFDKIQITGTASTNALPQLQNIETADLAYTEGSGSVQITSTITVSDADNATLSGATVRISTNFDSSEDQLVFVNQGGISGAYNTGTGVLTLSGTATLAVYQAALRSIRYQNSDIADASPLTRTVSFTVTDPAGGTNSAVTRNITVATALDVAAAPPYIEDFTTDGEGTRYATNDFTAQGNAATFRRTNVTPYTGGFANRVTFTNISPTTGSFYFYGTAMSNAASPNVPKPVYIQTRKIDASAYSNLRFQVRLGASSLWLKDDYIKLYYRLGNGSWVIFGSFRATDQVTTNAETPLRQDADPTNLSSAPTGTALTTALQNFSFALPAALNGQQVDFRIESASPISDAELAIDLIQVTGTINTAPTIGNQTRSVAENSANGTNVGAPIVAADADAGQTLTYAITAGNTGGTFAINTATGQLTVANSTALNFEVTPTYSLTVQVTDNGSPAASATATVTVNVTNVNEAPGAVTDVNPATNTVAENAANGTTVGITASATDPDAGTTLTYSLTNNAGGRFAINSSTGVVTVANGSLLDYETNTSHSITVQASDGALTSSQSFTIAVTDVDDTPPTVAITSTGNTNGGSTSTSPIPFTITFSESVTGFVQGDLTVSGGTISGFSGSGTTYTFNLIPSGNGTKTVNVPAAVAQDAAGNVNTAAAQFSITYTAPSATVASVTRLYPSPTATDQVLYRVVFSSNVTGLSTTNFSVTPVTGSIAGAAVSSVSGSGTTYTVVVNTGTGSGTLRLDVNSTNNLSPSVSNVPYTSGEIFTITKSFAAQPQLTIVGRGGTGSDVTAFVDVVQVLSGGSFFPNGLQNNSFETYDPLANGNYGYQPTGASWLFNAQAGIAESGSAFTPVLPIPNGIAVAFVQSNGGSNGQIQQNLAVPTGTSYQVSFQAAQRGCCTSGDQVLNVFLNGVYLGDIQPIDGNGYSTFTSPVFAVTAPVLTATVSTTSASPTSTAPIPFAVSFSQSVGTTFTASDVTVTGGTINGGSFAGNGSGPYTFTITPNGSGTVSVSLVANVVTDANNTGNTASNTVSVQYAQPVTAAPVVTQPANGSLTNNTTPTYDGTAAAGSTVTVYVDNAAIGTTTAPSGTWSLTQPTALSQGTHQVYARAQTSGSALSGNSNANTFTLDSVQPSVTITSTTAANNGTSSMALFAYTATFSEAVTGFVAGDVSVSNGAISGFTPVSGTTYTFNVTPSANGAVTVNVPASVAQDLAGNGNTAAPAYTITFVAPTIVVAPATLPNGAVAAAYSQTLSASGGTAPYIYAITAGALPAGLTLTSAGVLAGTPTASGSFNFTLRATDASAAPGPYSGSRAYTLTIAAPTITVAPASLPAGTVATAYSQTITASGGTAPYNFVITAGSLPVGLSLTSAGVLVGTPTGSGTFSFTVTATDATTGAGPYSESRAYSLSIGNQPVTAAPAILAPANNTFTNQAVAISGTAPANSQVVVYVSQNGGAFQVIPLTATAGGTFSTGAIAFSPATYTLYATAQSPGAAVSASSAIITFTVDQTAPAVTLTSTTAANSGTSSTALFAYTATFSEAVTGFVAGDVSVSNGAISGFTPVSGTTYTFNVTPSANGAVTVNVPASVAQDLAGNGNTAALAYTITYAQPITAAPVVTQPANGSLTNNTTPTYGGTAAAGSTVTVYVDNAAIGTTTAPSGTWSLTQPTALSQGTHQVYARAQTSGSALSGNSNANTFTVDSVQPSVTIGSTATNPTTTSPIPFTVTFSENVTGFVASDLIVTNGSVSSFSGSGNLYTFSVTPAASGTVSVSVPANVAQDAAGNGNNAATQFSIVYTVPVTVTIWTGAISTDWFTAGNWTAGVPTSTLDAQIGVVGSGNYPRFIAGTGSARNLTLSAGATLTHVGGTLVLSANLTNNGTYTATGGTMNLNGSTVQSIGGSSRTSFWNLTVGTATALLSGTVDIQRLLTLNGDLNTGGNAFTLLSNATATAMVVNNNGVVNGTATMQRYLDPSLNAGLGYRHYSSPVASTTVADLTTSTFTPVVNPAYNTVGNTVTPFPTVYGYDESRLNGTNATTQNFDFGYFSPASLADPLVRGRGYTVNIDAASKVDLVGGLNSGTIPVGALSRGTEANAGWHLLGNPYPAPLNWNVARTNLPTGVIDAVYVFKSSSQYAGTYQFYQNGFGTLPGGLIGSMQGFFVRVSQPVAAFNFLNTWRSTTYQNPSFNRTTADTRPAVQLELVSAQGARDAAFVYFEQGATTGMDDHYDAAKLPNTTGLNLASMVGSQQAAVNGLPVMGNAPVTVPLFIGLPATGSYTLHAAQLQNFAAGAQPWLRDLQLNTLTDLSQTPDYTFTMNAANTTPRFELVFGPAQVLSTSAALAAQVAVFPNPARSAVAVELPGSLSRQPVTAALVDALGRVVLQQVLPAGLSTHKLSLTNVATGVYTLRLSTSAGIIVKKLIVE